jgi:hypothetical protein
MTTASAMTVNRTSHLRRPVAVSRSLGRDAVLILGGLLWVSVMVYLFLAVTASWASDSTVGAPQASPAPAPIVQLAPINAEPVVVPALPQPGFLPR